MKNNGEQIKSQVVFGAVWKLAEKLGIQITHFIIQIVLARMLLPEDYGIIGLLSIFINISDVFLRQGFTTALIQKKNADEMDFSSVFIANLFMAIVIYLIFFLISPAVSVFYNEARLTAIMRILSLNVIIGAFAAVHNAILSKQLDFKKTFFCSMVNVSVQGIVGIYCAYVGFGVWALVLSKLMGAAAGTLVLFVLVKWKPKRMFSIQRIRKLFSFSSKVLAVNIINVVFNNIHSLIIGRYFHKAELGYYQRGQQFPAVMMTAVDGSLMEVLYPTISRLQDDLNLVKIALRRTMKTSIFLVYPLLFGLLAVADDVTLLLLTEKWLPCVPYIRLSCIVCAFWPFTARTQSLNALGLSKITFRLSLIAKGITLALIIACVPFGIYAIMLGTIFSSCITVWFTSYYVSKYIHYSVKEFILDILPTIFISIVMVLTVMSLGHMLTINLYARLFLEILAGAIIYIVLSIAFNRNTFVYVFNMIKGIIQKRTL